MARAAAFSVGSLLLLLVAIMGLEAYTDSLLSEGRHAVLVERQRLPVNDSPNHDRCSKHVRA